MTAFLPIVTERLVLRDFTMEDAPAVHRYGSDPAVVRYMPWGPNTWKDTEDFVKLKLADQRADPRRRFDLAVTLASSGELVGACGLYVISTERRQGAIGYVYRRDVMGEGLRHRGGEGARRPRVRRAQYAPHLLLRRRGQRRIGPGAGEDGHAAGGLVRHDAMMRGEWRDSYLYAILEDDRRAG